ncbi:MAG: hypothetical protein U0744_04570 [Gemmataceae bacterium]
MRQVTVKEVMERHGGMLPADATFAPTSEPPKAAAPQKPASRKGDNSKTPRSPRSSSRFPEFNTFVDFTMATLTGAERGVWLVLFRDTKSDTGTAQTGQTDIARRANISPRMVKRAVKSLLSKGLLKVVRRGRLNGGPSIYRVFATAHGAP